MRYLTALILAVAFTIGITSNGIGFEFRNYGSRSL